MIEVVYYVAASLDGFIAAPDGGVDWLEPFEGTGEDYGYAEFYASVDALLMGHRTFDKTLALGPWPYPGKPCRVFADPGIPMPDPAAAATRGAPAAVLQELERAGARRAWLVGGGVLASSFRTSGLLTQYVVTVVPVILGAGIPLFAGAGRPDRLRLREARTYPAGLVQLRYGRAGERSSP